jgi:hypothetical protein
MTLVRWIAVGLALDGLLLAVLWIAVSGFFRRSSPILWPFVAWVEATGLVWVPWLIHVVAVPRILSGRPLSQALQPTMTYLLSSILVIPALGGIIAALGGIAFLIAAVGLYPLLAALNLAAAIFHAVLPIAPDNGFSLIAPFSIWLSYLVSIWLSYLAVGSFLGLMIASFRVRSAEWSTIVRPRYDVIGGALGAVIACACFRSLSVGVLFAQVPTTPGLENLPIFLIAGLLVCLPHLILTACEIFRSPGFSPPPGT